MATEGRQGLAQILIGMRDSRQAGKVEHALAEMLVVAVCAVLSGADDFVEVEAWGKAKLGWLRQYLGLTHGIASHDTFGRLFAAIDAEEFGAAFRRWVGAVLPTLDKDEMVSVDGKTSRRAGALGATPLHLVSAFAANRPGAGTARHSREIQRQDGDSGSVAYPGSGRVHRHHRRHGHASVDCRNDSQPQGRLHPRGQGQPAQAGRIH